MSLRSWGLGDHEELCDSTRLTVSELVTNARQVTEVAGVIHLRLTLNGDALTIAVWDASMEKPTPDRTELTLEDIDNAPEAASPDELSEFGGWGLMIAEHLSYECGHQTVWPVGKWVWARLKVVA